MTTPDINLLVYAYRVEAPEYKAASGWLEDLFAGPETIGFTWIAIWGFVRLMTSSRVLRAPLTATQAFSIIRQWLSQPQVIILSPGERHVEILELLVTNHRAHGPLLTDAALAAIAIEHGATLASSDQDFSRFEGLKWINPLR